MSEPKTNANATVTEPGAAPDAATVQLSEDRQREIRAMSAAQIETRRQQMREVINGGGTVIAKAPAVAEKRTLESVIGSEAYLNAFANDIKNNTDRECRALLTDLVNGGQVPIPTYIA